MKRHIFILLTLLLSAAPLLAQYSPCFEAKFAEGKRLYSSGKYNQAKQYFNEAKDCPDPNAVAADEWIGKCKTALAEAERKAKEEAERQAKEEAERQKEAKAARERKEAEEAARKAREEVEAAYMKITKVEFGNVTDNNDRIDEFGSVLYDSDMRYLKPRITYDRKRNKNVTLDVKIIKPDRNMIPGKDSHKNYTYSTTTELDSGSGKTKELSGWGDDDKSIFSAGTYGFEIWHNGEQIYRTTFEIKPQSQQPVYDKLPDKEPYKTNAKNRDYIAQRYYNNNKYSKAAEWYRKAAEMGLAHAQNELGVMYYKGKSVEQNYNKAVEWQRKAAEQNYSWGQYNLGWCYEAGHGVGKDTERAKEWYQKAANQGHKDAQKRLDNLINTEKSLKSRPWEYRMGLGLGFQTHQFGSGSLPEDAIKGLGGLNVDLFFDSRKFLGTTQFFVKPSCAVSFCYTLVTNGSNLRVRYMEDYVFPCISFGKEMHNWDWSIGGGYYMDFMYKFKVSTNSNDPLDASLLSHYSGGLACMADFVAEENIGFRLIVGFPKSVECVVDGYDGYIKAPVIIFSIRFSGEFE